MNGFVVNLMAAMVNVLLWSLSGSTVCLVIAGISVLAAFGFLAAAS